MKSDLEAVLSVAALRRGLVMPCRTMLQLIDGESEIIENIVGTKAPEIYDDE